MTTPKALTPALMAVMVSAAACGGSPPATPAHTGGRVDPESGAERQVLAQLESLPSGQAVTIGGTIVQADPPYFAASGSTCRWLVLTPSSGGAAHRRLACHEGGAWFFAPDVLATPAGMPLAPEVASPSTPGASQGAVP